MLPFQQSNELCFQISSTTHQDHIIWEEDQLIMLKDDSFDIKKEKYKKNTESGDHDQGGEKFLCFSGNNNDNNNNWGQNKDDYDDCLRKSVHRETEKRRRQNMAQLYSSLRSLLPLEYIKGKRSISDHMMEAVKYTEDLQKKISELICKRDELKKIWRRFRGNDGNVDDPFPDIVQVSQCVGGLEILVRNGSSNDQEDVPLSRVLHTLLKEELCVVSCASVKVNGRLLHTIRSENGDDFLFDLQGLQWKLNQALGSTKFPK